MLSSYLSDWTQVICIEKSKSLQAPCNIGVPQGSILGPLLFILYINELPPICHSTQAIMNADDTVVFVSDRDINCINSKLSSDLATLHQWLHANPLTLNVKKTKCIHFKSPQKKLPIYEPITIYNEPLTVVNKYKYLGIILDANLTYKLHSEKVLKQMKGYLSTKKISLRLLPICIEMQSYSQKCLIACLSGVWHLNFKPC